MTAQVRIEDWNHGNMKYRTEDFASWFSNTISANFVEARIALVRSALVSLVCKLVEKGVLSVTEAIEMTDESGVTDAALPESR